MLVVKQLASVVIVQRNRLPAPPGSAGACANGRAGQACCRSWLGNPVGRPIREGWCCRKELWTGAVDGLHEAWRGGFWAHPPPGASSRGPDEWLGQVLLGERHVPAGGRGNERPDEHWDAVHPRRIRPGVKWLVRPGNTAPWAPKQGLGVVAGDPCHCLNEGEKVAGF